MSNFKRNSSRFNRDSGGSSGSSGGSRSSGGKKEYPPIVGNLLVPKQASDAKKDLAHEAAEALREEKVTLNLQINLPKGMETITLNRGDILWLSFFKFKTDKDFVLGHVSLPGERNSD
jgi:hypothetical protein